MWHSFSFSFSFMFSGLMTGAGGGMEAEERTIASRYDGIAALREAIQKKLLLFMVFFQNGLTPPPPTFGTFESLFPKIFNKKFQK